MEQYTVEFFDLEDFNTIVELMELENSNQECVFSDFLKIRVCKNTLKDVLFWLNSMPYIEFVIINPRIL